MSNGICKEGMNRKIAISGFVAVVLVLLVFGAIQPVSATWTKKAPIHINNTAGSALTDYQVMLNITYDSDMNNNFSDIRVVNETSGETVPYWIEDKADGSWCKLWFNASYIPANSWCNDTYYLYYGNPSASSASDGEATFELFDDWQEKNKWTERETGMSENTSDPYKQEVGGPFIFKVGDTFHMYYDGFDTDNNGYIMHVTSDDGINWVDDPNNPVLSPTADEYRVRQCSIVIVNGTWHMYYQTEGTGVWEWSISHATSNDGVNWTKEPNNPIIDPSYRVAQPSVIYKDGEFYLFIVYHGDESNSSGSPGRVELWKSTDGSNFTKEADVLVGEDGWENYLLAHPQVYEYNGKYLMYYCGRESSNMYIGLAESTDLVNWTKCAINPIIKPAKLGGVSEESVEAPSIIQLEEGKWVLYYESERNNATQIIGRYFFYGTVPDCATLQNSETPQERGWVYNIEGGSSEVSTTTESITRLGRSLKLYVDGSNKIQVYKSFAWQPNMAIDAWIKSDVWQNRDFIACGKNTSGFWILCAGLSSDDTSPYKTYWNETGGSVALDWVADTNPLTDGEWYRFILIHKGGGVYSARIYDKNGNLIAKSDDDTLASTDPSSVDINAYTGRSNAGTTLFNLVVVRKYVSPEPSALLGAEQNVGGNASISVSDGSINFGNLQLNTVKNTVDIGDTQTISTAGAGGAQKIEIKLNSSTVVGANNGTTLTFVTGSPGINEIKCEFKGGDVGSYTALTDTYQIFDDSMPADSTASLDIQLTMPSTVSNDNYYDNYQFEIIIRATLL